MGFCEHRLKSVTLQGHISHTKTPVFICNKICVVFHHAPHKPVRSQIRSTISVVQFVNCSCITLIQM